MLQLIIFSNKNKYPKYSLSFKSPHGYAWVNYLDFFYVLPCSFKSPHGYACMERISKLIDLIDKLILIPIKSPHGHAWLEDT